MSIINCIFHLFRCRHADVGRPVTWKDETGRKRTTVFCQSCGARLSYDLTRMRKGQAC